MTSGPRRGLSYGWWRREQFWAGLSAVLLLTITILVVSTWVFGC